MAHYRKKNAEAEAKKEKRAEERLRATEQVSTEKQ